MSDEPNPARRSKRAYVRVCDRRKRGAQPGNLNALKHGGFTALARGRDRALSLLLKEAHWAVLMAQPFVGKPLRRRKKFVTNGSDRPDETSA